MIMDVHEDDVLVFSERSEHSSPFCRGHYIDLRLFTHIPPTSLKLLPFKETAMGVYETRALKPGDLTDTDIVIVWVPDSKFHYFLPQYFL
jgi:hypothetical protein